MTLLFIHGSGGSKESWRYQTEHFKDAVAVDLPGHPDGEPCASVEEYMEWIRGVIAEEGYRDVVLVGHSLGGAIALMHALSHPGELQGIIMVGSGARLRVHPMLLEMLGKAVSEPERFRQFVDQGSSRVDPGLAEVLKRRQLENGPAVMLNDLRACDRFDVMDRLGEISVPTLAICGTEDEMTPPKYSHYLADHISGARAVIIPGGTHMVFAEKPEEVNRAIDAFIKGLIT